MATLAPKGIKRQGVLEQKDDTLYEYLSEEAIAAMRGVYFNRCGDKPIDAERPRQNN